jgi:two-component system chemotaxis sensor kinase CheA
MVKLSNQSFALPLASVVEILSLDLNKTNHVDGQLVVMVRSKALPLYNLGKWLINGYVTDPLLKGEHEQERHVVVVSLGKQNIGFIVDNLVGQEEVVIKPLGALLTDVKGLSGATISGDGSIALILDIPSLMMRYSGRSGMMM